MADSPGRQTPNLVEAHHWGWRYAGRADWAISDLTLTIAPGEKVLLLGPSGAGKSTLLLALAGVLGSADEGIQEGRLLVAGQHPTRRVGQIGLVQQDPQSQIVMAKVGDDVAFGCENQGIAPQIIWTRVSAALRAVGLDTGLDRQTAALSGGQQQRLVLAGTLAMQTGGQIAESPRLLLFDEPTANLDPKGVKQLIQAVARLSADRATGLIVVEHRVGAWADLMDRVIVLDATGRVVADGPPGDVFDAHGDDLAAIGVWVPGKPPLVPVMRMAPAQTGPPPLSSTDHGGCKPAFVPQLPTVIAVPALRAVDLTIGYDQPVLEHINLSITAGQSTVITGDNGIGKSALALTLAGLLPPLGGQVVAGDDLVPTPSNRRQRRLAQLLADPRNWTPTQLLTRLGTVFQQPEHQFVTASVRDELSVGLKALGWAPASVTARVDELLQTLRLDALAEANPFTLSGGEKRRLSVGAVLATRPAVVILDEPTFGQDRTTWAAMVSLIADLIQNGTTVISVTHDDAYIAALGQHHIRLGADHGSA